MGMLTSVQSGKSATRVPGNTEGSPSSDLTEGLSTKYHVEVKRMPPRFTPIARLNAMEIEGCLGCRKCVKRESCVYGVYRDTEYSPYEFVDTGDTVCVACMRCVQECKKGILSRAVNPRFTRMGDDHFRPEMIASLVGVALME